MDWDTATLELTERVTSFTSFLSEQTLVLVEALVGTTTLLDLCIGYGNVAKALIDQGKSVTGVDVSEDSLAYARKKVGESKRLNLVKMDVGKIGYGPVFDGAYCASSLPRTDESLNNVISNTYRSLKKEGIFAVTYSDQEAHNQKVGAIIKSKYEKGEIIFTEEEISLAKKIGEQNTKLHTFGRPLTPQRITEALEHAGFKITAHRGFYDGIAYCISAKK